MIEKLEKYKRFDSQRIFLEPKDYEQLIICSIGEWLGFRWIYLNGPYDYMCKNVLIDNDLPHDWHWSAQIKQNTIIHIQFHRSSTGDDNIGFELANPSIIKKISRWQQTVAYHWLTRYQNSKCRFPLFHSKYLLQLSVCNK